MRRSGEKIFDSQRLDELTRFLQKHAGLTFYHQLYRTATTTSVSPLLQHKWVRLIEYSDTAETDVVCGAEHSDSMHIVKFSTADSAHQNEMKIHAKVANTECVASLDQYGLASPDVLFGIGEHVTHKLSDCIVPGRGIEDDEKFWRFASQLARGVADIHGEGIVHLTIQVRSPRLWRLLTCVLTLASPEHTSREICG